MTGANMDRAPHRLDDLAAYALGALEGDAASELAAHLSGCPDCRAELARLRGTVDLLALGAPPVAVPRSLRRRLLAEVRGAPSTARARRRSRSPRLVLPLPSVRVPALPVAALVALAVLVAVTLSSGGTATRIVTAHVAFPAASVRLQVSGGHAELVVKRFPAPPPGKIYEVWLARSGRPPAPTDALFDIPRTGRAVVAVPGDISGVSAVMVTAEPAGGSDHPTGTPVIIARL
jgi:anti-sigma-K factor RskA